MSFIMDLCYFKLNCKLNIIKAYVMKVGDKVLCINDKNWYKIPVRGICEGLIYKLTEVFECKCGNIYVRMAEVTWNLEMWCPGCNTMEFTRIFYHIERFRKIEEGEMTDKESVKEEIKEKVAS